MDSISYGVGWHDGARKFTMRERRSFRYTQNVTDHGAYDTFRAAYEAAVAAYSALSGKQPNVYLISERTCCEQLQGSWGMSKAQKEEISGYLPKEAPAMQQGRGDLPEHPADASPARNEEIDLSRFTPAQQLVLKQGMDMGLPVWLYANPMYTPEEMAGLRSVLETTLYARTHPEERVVATDNGPEVVSQGFKSYSNFLKYPDRVCYVPENWDFAEDGPGYTARDILEECGGDPLKAEIIFDLCTWQHPSSVLGEWDIDDERALEQIRSERAAKQRSQAEVSLSSESRPENPDRKNPLLRQVQSAATRHSASPTGAPIAKREPAR